MDYWKAKANTLQDALTSAEDEILALRRELRELRASGNPRTEKDPYDTLTDTVQGLLDQARMLKPVLSGALTTIIENVRHVRDEDDTKRTDNR